MKKVLIFGSTGSIGKNALDVIRHERNYLEVLGLAASRDIKTLYAQIKEFKPRYVAVMDETAAAMLKNTLPKGVRLLIGEEGMEEFSSLESDISLMAIAGIACLKPLFTNIKHSRRIALANKESVVVAGDFVFKEATRCNTKIIPVDSEICSLFQLLTMDRAYVHKVYLTASGGSLFSYESKKLSTVKIKDVIAHPTWRMGRRITVDSATLVNKAFEVVETRRFFNMPYEKIDVVIHRESMIHALVECNDGTFFSCMYYPDMRIPITYALSYPARSACLRLSSTISSRNKEKKLRKQEDTLKNIAFGRPFTLSFVPLDKKRFYLFSMIIEAAKKNDNALIILNAGDEVAIEYFLNGQIKFTHIHKVLEYLFTHYPAAKINSANDVFYWDMWARSKTKAYVKKLVALVKA